MGANFQNVSENLAFLVRLIKMILGALRNHCEDPILTIFSSAKAILKKKTGQQRRF